jgi:uncharacterized protein YbcI
MVVALAGLVGGELLDAVTVVMVGLHQRYYDRVLVSAKSLLMGGDLLVMVLGGVCMAVEQTMIELQRSIVVGETRRAFQTAMADKFIGAVERLSGRHVLAFTSNHHVDPDIETEISMLQPQKPTRSHP